MRGRERETSTAQRKENEIRNEREEEQQQDTTHTHKQTYLNRKNRSSAIEIAHFSVCLVLSFFLFSFARITFASQLHLLFSPKTTTS
jgi:hypothetical protein